MDPVQTQQNTFGKEFVHKPKRLLLILPIVVFLMLFWNWLSSPMIVVVNGTGEVTVPATNSVVTFALSANDINPESAIANVKVKAQIFRDLLKNSGILEEDITESQINVIPASAIVPGQTGYQATISMGAKTIHVSSISDLVASLYVNGSDYVSQPVVSVEDTDLLEQKAFDEALKDAKSEAGRIGWRNWKLFRKIVAIEQLSSGTTSTSTSKADVITETNDEVAATNGVFKILKAVSVTYKMW